MYGEGEENCSRRDYTRESIDTTIFYLSEFMTYRLHLYSTLYLIRFSRPVKRDRVGGNDCFQTDPTKRVILRTGTGKFLFSMDIF